MKFLNIKPSVEVGQRLGDFFAEHASEELLDYLKEHRALVCNLTIQRLFLKTMEETRGLELNLFKRLRLMGAFRARLLLKGVDEDAIDNLSHVLVQALSGVLTAQPVEQKPAAAAASPEEARNTDEELRSYVEAKDFLKAEILLRARVAQDPQNTTHASNYSAVLLEVGKTEEGIRELRRTISLNPALPVPYLNLASVLLWQGNFVEAEKNLRKVLSIEPNNVKALSTLGMLFQLSGKPKESEIYYKKALEIDSCFVMALSGLGSLYAAKGEKDQAKTFYEAALKANPKFVDALLGLLPLYKEEVQRDELAHRMKALLQENRSRAEEVSLKFALGDYYDKKNEPKEAFALYKQANELKKRSMKPYDPVLHSEINNKMVRLYTADVLNKRAPQSSPSERPVFIVGMMRSGTSLVEHIVASHPDVHGAGELDFWHHVFLNRRELIDTRLPTGKEISKLAAQYLETLRGYSSGALRVVDKSTFNLSYAGLIHTVFPKARIIVMQRDPRDTCFSCYSKDFANGAAFAMDLESLAHFYKEHLKLVRHWHKTLPSSSLLIVPYEQLVAEQEHWSRKIIDFLGLEWDERVLEFHKTKRVVSTASALQVREKMNDRSIGRWRAYERYLGPVLNLENEFTARM